MGAYARFLGSGPSCLIAGIVVIILSFLLELIVRWNIINIPQIPISDAASNISFVVAIILTISLYVWGSISLPEEKKGKKLVTTGAYRFIRHPHYASFLNFFVIGMALYFKSYGIVVADLILIYLCGQIVDKEERYLKRLFGKKYEKYRARTKKFVPWVY